MPSLEGTVVAVGEETSIYLEPLLARLTARGLQHLAARSIDDLTPTLAAAGSTDRVAVLVYNGPRAKAGRQVLEALGSVYPDVPVIIVVNDINLDDYYELMSQGAYDYFGLTEGTEVIEQAVRWAAQTDAVSARAAACRSDSSAKAAPEALPSASLGTAADIS